MITITGATGQLGHLIINGLLEEKDAAELRAIVRSPHKLGDLAALGVQLKQGDYDHPDELASAFASTDVLMFTSNTDFTKRKQQHENVVDAAKSAGVRRIVYTSFIQSDSDDMLTTSHGDTEAYIEASGVPGTILRDNFYMDPYAVEVEIAMKTGVYRTPTAPEVGAALITRADVARMAVAVLIDDAHAGKTYDLTGPAVVSPMSFVEAASTLSGKPVTHQQITWEELADDYRKRGMPAEYVQLSVMLERFISSGKLATVSDDIETVTGQPAKGFLPFVQEKLKK